MGAKTEFIGADITIGVVLDTIGVVYIVLHKFKVCSNDWLSGVAKNVSSRDSTIKNLGPSTALQQH